MPRTSNSRQRFLDTAAVLFRRQGFAGTGLKEITAAAEAPWGSLYHHFPGGKSQLAAEAMRASGEGYRRLLSGLLDTADDPIDGLLRFFDLAADTLEASDFANGCPVATTALDTASIDPVVREACASVFTDWLDDIATALRSQLGDRADAVALVGLTTLEGAFILSRTLRSTEPMRTAGAELARLIEPLRRT